jgi:hypothetical protein
MLQMLNGIGRVRVPAAIVMSWSLGGICLMWAYLSWVQKSMLAAIVIITIARVVGTIAHLIYGLRVLKIPSGKMLFGSILRPGIVGGGVCGISYFFIKVFDVYKPFHFISVVILLGIIYSMLVVMVVLSGLERKSFIAGIHLFFQKTKLLIYSRN